MGHIIENQIGYLLRRANQRHTAIFQKQIGIAELTPAQFIILAKLDDVEQTSQNELGRLTGLDPATTQGVIQRLIERSMVLSHSIEADRRRKILNISAQGKKVLDEAYESADRITEDMLSPLTPVEQSNLLQLLKKLL